MDLKISKTKFRYQKLLGLNRQKAEEMRDQIIDFPQSVEELQILCLQLREELIEARSAKEHSVAELKDELTLMQEQLKEEQIDRKRVEEQISKEYSKVTADLDFARNQVSGDEKKSHNFYIFSARRPSLRKSTCRRA